MTDEFALSQIAALRARVEQLEARVAALDGQSAAPDGVPGMDPQVLELARSGNAIQAIKLYREQTGLGLAEAKAAIDRLMGGGSGLSLH